MDANLPLIERTTAEALAKTVGVAFEPWMQDWPLEVADADRVEEFLSHYEREHNPEHRVAIAVLVVASLDRAFALGMPSPHLLERAGPILKNYPEIIEYWSCPDAHKDDEMFHLTPWIRSLRGMARNRTSRLHWTRRSRSVYLWWVIGAGPVSPSVELRLCLSLCE